MLISIALTIVAGGWRFLDGRGWPRITGVRNAAGLIVALGCAANLVDGLTATNVAVAAICALLAWVTLISGHTRWESWVSVARYGGPSCVIAVIAYLGGSHAEICGLYALAGLLTGFLYTILHRYVRDFGFNTAACEVVAGMVIIGGISWL